MGLRFWNALAVVLVLAGCGSADETNLPAADRRAGGDVAQPAANAEASAPATAATGRQYVELVGASDLYEIESARLAQQKARRLEVREFAGMLLAEHRRSTAALERAAARAQPPIPIAPALNAEQQANLQALGAARGATFDPVWMRQQVNAHEQALTLVTAYAASGEIEALRQHAASVAGPIQQHLARARALEVPAPRPKQ